LANIRIIIDNQDTGRFSRCRPERLRYGGKQRNREGQVRALPRFTPRDDRTTL
jgi:hypothetical protein